MRLGVLNRLDAVSSRQRRVLSNAVRQGLERAGSLNGRVQLTTSRRLRQVACAASTLPKAPPGLTNAPWTGSVEQLRALEEVKGRTQNLPGGQPEEEMLKWFLRDRNMDVEETVEKLKKVAAWRDRVRPDALSEDDVVHQLAMGKGFLHEHCDVTGRPVIVVKVAKHFPGGRGEPEASRTFCTYLMETALQRLPPDMETVLGVFDFEGSGPQNIDLEFARFLIDLFFYYYPKRLGQVLMVDAPWVFQPPWRLIRPMLRKYARLVRFVNAEQVRNEFFTPETVPKDFKR